jgi:hypothetical protein
MIMIRQNTNAEWRMPPELARYTPREVQLSAAGRFLTALIVLLCIAAPVAGVSVWFAAERGRDRLVRIERDGIWVEGSIVAAGRDSRKDGAAFVRYEYVVDGRTYSRQITVGRRGRRLLNVGGRLRVRYLAGSPEMSWPAGYEPQAPPVWILGFVPVIFLGLALVLARVIAGQRRLLAEGRGAPGRITGSRKVNDDDGTTHYRVEIDFQTLSGATRQIKVMTSGRPSPAGAMVTVLYDSDNPRSASLYPLSLVRARDR